MKKNFAHTYKNYNIDIVYEITEVDAYRGKDYLYQERSSSTKTVKISHPLTCDIKEKHIISKPFEDIIIDPSIISKYYGIKTKTSVYDFDGYDSENDDDINSTLSHAYTQTTYKIIKATIIKKNRKIKGSIILNK